MAQDALPGWTLIATGIRSENSQKVLKTRNECSSFFKLRFFPMDYHVVITLR